MPRGRAAAVKNKRLSTVAYVNAKGRTVDMTIVAHGAGADQLNLRYRGGAGMNRVLTNVPKRTAMGQTNVWFVRP